VLEYVHGLGCQDAVESNIDLPGDFNFVRSRVGEAITPLPRALEIVAGPQDRATVDPATQERLARSIVLLLSADVWMFKPICWKRAAVLHRYLSQTRIIFGVRNDSTGNVTGHAWLEAEGQPILETTPPEYVATYKFPSTDRFDPQLAAISLE